MRWNLEIIAPNTSAPVAHMDVTVYAKTASEASAYGKQILDSLINIGMVDASAFIDNIYELSLWARRSVPYPPLARPEPS